MQAKAFKILDLCSCGIVGLKYMLTLETYLRRVGGFFEDLRIIKIFCYTECNLWHGLETRRDEGGIFREIAMLKLF